MTPLVAGLAAPFLVNTAIFLVAQFMRDNSIVDIGWGVLFIASNLAALLYQHDWDLSSWGLRQKVLFALIAVWGVRLSIHIGLRHKGEEDFRYQSMRRRWMAKGGQLYTHFMAFAYVFMMQACFSLMINASSLHVMLNSKQDQTLTLFDYIGIAIFTAGFLFETIADS